MTLVSAIQLSAYRESNLIAESKTSLSANQSTESLAKLNSLIAGIMGFEAGENLRPWAVGTAGMVDPPAEIRQEVWKYPTINSRLILNHSQAETIYFPSKPSDGARMAVLDVGSQLATYNVTLDGNGRLIESARTLVLSTAALNRVWFYRADLGDWKRVSTLATTDEMPFPTEFDDMFSILLAIRLNPRYGRKLDPQTEAMLARSQRMFAARYVQSEDLVFNPAFQRNPDQSYDGYYDTADASQLYGV